MNAKLDPLTGWRVVGVPGLIPDATFYDHLAHRRFPVTVWIRKRSEIDYLVEPDLFHDFFGHVPLLSNPIFADYMQRYGQRAMEAGAYLQALTLLAAHVRRKTIDLVNSAGRLQAATGATYIKQLELVRPGWRVLGHLDVHRPHPVT